MPVLVALVAAAGPGDYGGVDIVTFAGSLFYTKTLGLRRELVRVCPPGGRIVVFDFEFLLDEVMADREQTSLQSSPIRTTAPISQIGLTLQSLQAAPSDLGSM